MYRHQYVSSAPYIYTCRLCMTVVQTETVSVMRCVHLGYLLYSVYTDIVLLCSLVLQQEANTACHSYWFLQLTRASSLAIYSSIKFSFNFVVLLFVWLCKELAIPQLTIQMHTRGSSGHAPWSNMCHTQLRASKSMNTLCHSIFSLCMLLSM